MRLLSLPKFGSGTGLHRVNWLLGELKIDREWLSRSSIAVTGSNGKGSTSAILHSLGLAHGLRGGLFTSPHLYDFRERYRIDGKPIDSKALGEAESRALALVESYERSRPNDRFGVFEVLFAVAADWFYRQNCQLCVFEAGIGGRFDPTRLAGAEVAIVTSLDLEHTELLGESVEQICFDKSDICRTHGTVLYGENCSELSAKIETYCALRTLEPRFLGQGIAASVREEGKDGTEFSLSLDEKRILSLNTPLLGRHQVNNAALAVSAFEIWTRRFREVKFSEEKAKTGLTAVHWPGRLERIGDDPLTIVDVGHTPDGVRAALSGLQSSFPGLSWVLVTGVSKNKKIDEILSLLASGFETIICTSAHHKGAPAEEIAATLQNVPGGKEAKSFVANTIHDAVTLAREVAGKEKVGIYVAGGLFVAAEFAWVFRGGKAEELNFLG